MVVERDRRLRSCESDGREEDLLFGAREDFVSAVDMKVNA